MTNALLPKKTPPKPSTEPWERFLKAVFPEHFQDVMGRSYGFSDFHKEFWRWVWSIKAGEIYDPFFSVWPRDTGKSTCAELACVILGARRVRRYILYVSGTQEQADDHVQNVGALLDNDMLAKLDREITKRAVTRYGVVRGWRRNRLITASGFLIDALGLNTAARGIKFENQRPDAIIFDDVDDENDSLDVVEKKEKMITRKILPAGARDVTVLGAQNLVHPNSVFTRLVEGRSDFLVNRYVSGPHPAIRNLTYERKDGKTILTGGTPTWAGLDLERAQKIVDDIGLKAFQIEHQHDVGLLGGVYFDFEEWKDKFVEADMEIPPWWPRWISMDWGYKHHSAIYWHAQGADKTGRPVTYTYREEVLNKATTVDLGKLIAEKSVFPNGAPEDIDAFYLSPDAFAERTAADTIAQQIEESMLHERPDLPAIGKADNDRKGGWMLMYQLLDRNLWKISKACPGLIESLPKLMRDEKDVEDIVKNANIEDDCADGARYGIKSRLQAEKEPQEDQIKRKLAEHNITEPTAVALQSQVALSEMKGKAKPIRRGRSGGRFHTRKRKRHPTPL